jgi:YggT family protein
MPILVELIQLIVRLIMTLLIFRFWMQWAGVNFYNPIAQLIVRFTEPMTKFLRGTLPRGRRYDWGSLIAIFILAVAMWLLHFAMIDFSLVRVESIFSRSLVFVLNVTLSTLFFTLIIRAIASWVAVAGNNPALELIIQLTDPLLTPIRRIIPPSGGLDFSPLILMLIIWLAMRILQQYFLV